MLKNTIFELKKTKRALVFGSGHGIGLALTKYLLESNSEIEVHATYNDQEKAFDLFKLKNVFQKNLHIQKTDPSSDKSLKELSDYFIKNDVKIDLLINCIGFLSTDNINPEKSLNDLNRENLIRYFEINTIPTALIAKYFYKSFNQKSVSCFVNLSAKVGSIDDNRMGGWYGYRSSKSAQNMMIKNIALELARKKLNIITLSVHPGTTITELSRPYIANTKLKLHQPFETAKNITNIIDGLDITQSGSFLSWDGSQIPW